jgi:hypothetical protein
MDNTSTYRDTMRYSNEPPFSLGKEERRLIEALRKHIGWGEATVVLKDGKPVMLRGLREDVKLTDDRD